jgi:alcohol-forming fatty acyl-CoA reductase
MQQTVGGKILYCRGGFIEETIEEDNSLDLDMFVESVLQMPEAEIEQKQKEILGKFPNTYNYSKNIAEKLLKKHRGDLPLVIIRPSIIGAAAQEPFPGWVDSITAATAVYLTGSLGILKDL